MEVLLEELTVALLDVYDGVVLFLYSVVVLLQVQMLEGASHHDLLKQGTHVLGVACRERPTHVVSFMLGVAHSKLCCPHYGWGARQRQCRRGLVGGTHRTP
jgi:hypothetical protein